MVGLVANRRFLAYLTAAALADGGFWIAYVAQGWLVLSLTNSPFWLGILAGTRTPPLPFRPAPVDCGRECLDGAGFARDRPPDRRRADLDRAAGAAGLRDRHDR